MSLFKLDPLSIQSRATAQKTAIHPRSLCSSIIEGAIGFGLVGVLAFSVWAFAGKELSSAIGEPGFYAVVSIVFIGLAGFALGRLVSGPGCILRFHALFTPAFILYSIIWCLFWFGMGDSLGKRLQEVFGFAFALIPICLTLLKAMGAPKGKFLPTWGVFYLFSMLGYFFGEPWLYKWAGGKSGMLLWGLFYGAGFGAGAGYLIHQAQSGLRKQIPSGT